MQKFKLLPFHRPHMINPSLNIRMGLNQQDCQHKPRAHTCIIIETRRLETGQLPSIRYCGEFSAAMQPTISMSTVLSYDAAS